MSWRCSSRWQGWQEERGSQGQGSASSPHCSPWDRVGKGPSEIFHPLVSSIAGSQLLFASCFPADAGPL